MKVCVSQRRRSSLFLEANLGGLLAETSSAEHNLVLADEAFLVGAHAACAAVFSEFAWVRAELVWHDQTTLRLY